MIDDDKGETRNIIAKAEAASTPGSAFEARHRPRTAILNMPFRTRQTKRGVMPCKATTMRQMTTRKQWWNSLFRHCLISPKNNQFGRRNLSEAWKITLVLGNKNDMLALGKAKMVEGGGDRGILGYANATDAINKHCKIVGLAKRESQNDRGQMRETVFINESNLLDDEERGVISNETPSEAKRMQHSLHLQTLSRIPTQIPRTEATNNRGGHGKPCFT